ncbi:MAG TPA: serine--tRNA ligase [Myxococcales bacterium]|nr:serine--tRNA ligase [Myxococcales bacterium]
MLDIRYVLDNAEAVQKNCDDRLMPADVAALVEMVRERNVAITEMEDVRRQMNENARSMKQPLEPEQRQDKIAHGRALKQRVGELDQRANDLRDQVNSHLRVLPNLTHPDVPVGRDEEQNRELYTWGEPPKFDFPVQDHVELGRALDLIDFESGAAVAGQKFYFLRNEMVLLDLALQRYAIDLLVARGYTPVITPDLARPEVLEGIGFNPRGDETQVYNIEGHDLCLIGTAEITIGGMLRDEIIDRERLPLRIAGISHCFRTEAGAAGRESRGLYRVHQFTKVEMFIFSTNEFDDEGRPVSQKHHDELLEIEEELLQGLEIPYRVVDVCTGDLGAPAYRKYDIEAWMPGRQAYGEVTSTSNCLDYQSRRLGIRTRPEGNARGKPQYVHTLNGTAVALSRTAIALLENHQKADGSIAIPAGLRPYLPFESIQAKS